MLLRFLRGFPSALIATGLTVLFLATAQAHAAESSAPHHAQWESAIAAFETADKTNPPPRHAIEFLGSSSIRLWTSAPVQFPDHTIFNRGFGGSHLGDSVAFVERIVIPYAPKIVVLYAGDNVAVAPPLELSFSRGYSRCATAPVSRKPGKSAAARPGRA